MKTNKRSAKTQPTTRRRPKPPVQPLAEEDKIPKSFCPKCYRPLRGGGLFMLIAEMEDYRDYACSNCGHARREWKKTRTLDEL